MFFYARTTRTSIAMSIFSAFLKPFTIPQMNLCSAHSRVAIRHSQHFIYCCTFNFIFIKIHERVKVLINDGEVSNIVAMCVVFHSFNANTPQNAVAK